MFDKWHPRKARDLSWLAYGEFYLYQIGGHYLENDPRNAQNAKTSN